MRGLLDFVLLADCGGDAVSSPSDGDGTGGQWFTTCGDPVCHVAPDRGTMRACATG